MALRFLYIAYTISLSLSRQGKLNVRINMQLKAERRGRCKIHVIEVSYVLPFFFLEFQGGFNYRHSEAATGQVSPHSMLFELATIYRCIFFFNSCIARKGSQLICQRLLV